MSGQNTSPIYTLVPKRGSATLLPATTANVKSDGAGTIGTDMLLAFTCHASQGSYVSSIRFTPVASAAATTTTATTLRAFVSTQASGATTNANTYLIAEVAAAAQVADHSTNATFYLEVPINKALALSDTILVSTHVVPATSTAWQVLVFAGDYA
jgi:hypothetical protein